MGASLNKPERDLYTRLRAVIEIHGHKYDKASFKILAKWLHSHSIPVPSNVTPEIWDSIGEKIWRADRQGDKKAGQALIAWRLVLSVIQHKKKVSAAKSPQAARQHQDGGSFPPSTPSPTSLLPVSKMADSAGGGARVQDGVGTPHTHTHSVDFDVLVGQPLPPSSSFAVGGAAVGRENVVMGGGATATCGGGVMGGLGGGSMGGSVGGAEGGPCQSREARAPPSYFPGDITPVGPSHGNNVTLPSTQYGGPHNIALPSGQYGGPHEAWPSTPFSSLPASQAQPTAPTPLVPPAAFHFPPRPASRFMPTSSLTNPHSSSRLSIHTADIALPLNTANSLNATSNTMTLSEAEEEEVLKEPVPPPMTHILSSAKKRPSLKPTCSLTVSKSVSTATQCTLDVSAAQTNTASTNTETVTQCTLDVSAVQTNTASTNTDTVTQTQPAIQTQPVTSITPSSGVTNIIASSVPTACTPGPWVDITHQVVEAHERAWKTFQEQAILAGDLDILQAFPVCTSDDRQPEWRPFSYPIMKDVKKAITDYGLNSPFTMGLMDSFFRIHTNP